MVPLHLLLKILVALAVAAPISVAASDRETAPERRRSHVHASTAIADWTCIVPYYNEASAIEHCLSSLATQSTSPRVILVDNGSTDGSRLIAERSCLAHGIRFDSLTELRPGKVAALAKGLAATTTIYVATCDADTFYPPDYLSRATALLGRKGIVAAGAILITDPRAKFRSLFERGHGKAAAAFAPWQCHSGGAGQAFRTDALRGVGGFDPDIWNFVLEDHEVMARLGMVGQIAYDDGFWCSPKVRTDRHGKSGWNLAERVCYHMTARHSMPAYFNGYLAPRLAERGLWNTKLRPTEPVSAPSAHSFAPTILLNPPPSAPA